MASERQSRNGSQPKADSRKNGHQVGGYRVLREIETDSLGVIYEAEHPRMHQKVALRTIPAVDLFIVGHTAPEQTREEMVAWLRANYPKVKIVALNPSKDRQLTGVDYNVLLNDHNEWLSLIVAAAS